MRLASVQDIPHMVSVLTAAFSEDPHVFWFIGKPQKQQTNRRRRETLMNYLCHATVSTETAWMSDDGNATALWQSSELRPRGVRFLLANLGYLFICGLRATIRSLKMEANVRRRLPREPHLFLWTIGINESARGKGVFRELISPILAAASDRKIPVYLETTVERNVRIYEHYGFHTVSSYTMDDSPTIHFMRKE